MHASRSLFLLAVLFAASVHAGPLTDEERAIAETYIARRAEFVEQRVKELEGKIATEQKSGNRAKESVILAARDGIELVKSGRVRGPQLRDTELKAGDVGYLLFLRKRAYSRQLVTESPRVLVNANPTTVIVGVTGGLPVVNDESILFVRDGSIENLADQCVYVRGKRPYTSPSGTTYNLWECVAVDIDDLVMRYRAEQAASKAQAATQAHSIHSAIERLTAQRDELMQSRASRYRAAERQVKLYEGMNTPAGREKLRDAQQSLQALGDVPGDELEAYDARDKELAGQLLDLRRKLAAVPVGR